MSAQVSFAVRGHSQLFHRDVTTGDDFNLENATIQDFLEDVAEYHRIKCGCQVNIGKLVWLVSDALDDAAMRGERPAATDALALETRLHSLHGPHMPKLNLLIDGEALDFGTNEFLRLAREKRFIPYSHDAGTVFRRSGSKAVLPSENVPSYRSLCTTPGSVFVDKTAFIRSLLNKFISSRVNIIRKPRGFGKTTFLSMVDAYFDPHSPTAYFPFIFEPDLVPESLFAAHGQMLIFAMDFAKLALYDDTCGEDIDMDEDDNEDADGVVAEDESDKEDEDMFEEEYASGDEWMGEVEFAGTYVSDEAMLTRCYAFLDDAARTFYARYEHILHRRMKAENRGEIIPTFADILRWSKQEDYSLVFLIDNYTAPLRRCSDPRIQRAIARTIFHSFADLAKGGLVSYGLLVGEAFRGAEDWIGMPSIWRDLSNSPDLSEAIGLTESEVVALGQAISVDLLPTLQSLLPLDQRDDKRLLYASADVLTIARGLINPDMSFPPSLSVRTLEIPPPIEEVPLNTLGHRRNDVLFEAGAWPEVFDDEEIDICTGYPDDDDDAVDDSFADSSWEGRRPALTNDGSSASSSSPSTSDSSAESVSGGMKKPVLILGGLESPLLGYPRKKLQPEDSF